MDMDDQTNQPDERAAADRREHRERMVTNVILLLIFAVLVGIGIWLAEDYQVRVPVRRDGEVRWVVRERNPRLSSSSLRDYLGVPPRFARHLSRTHRDILPFSPLAGVELPRVEQEERVPLTRQEWDLLMAYAGKTRDALRNRAMLWLLLDTGMRVGSMAGEVQDRRRQPVGVVDSIEPFQERVDRLRPLGALVPGAPDDGEGIGERD